MNEREFRVIGMSRSGSHAIINWMLSQAAGRRCFVNCAEPKSNPFETARPLDDGRRIVANYPDFDPARELRGDFSAKDVFLFSHEDCFLGPMSRGAFEVHHDDMVGRSRLRYDVLILRDPYNLMASRIKGGFGVVSGQVALRIWKQHAREFLGLCRNLRQRRVLINYNRWAGRRSYRRWIAAELGLHFSDSAVATVPPAGNGSSFDGQRYNGQAGKMKTALRWAHFEGDPEFSALFDSETHALARRIFGKSGFSAQRQGGIRTAGTSPTPPDLTPGEAP